MNVPAVQPNPSSAEIAEIVIAKGDLSKLSAQERNNYYLAVCQSVGLNPLTRPLEYLVLSGRTVLYARKDCTDQLRSIHKVSVTEMVESERDGVYIVTSKVQNAEGRTDIAKGAVNIASLKGEALANAIMKAETKSKRRATLSICGLGILDESELDTIPAHEKKELKDGDTPSRRSAPSRVPSPNTRRPAPQRAEQSHDEDEQGSDLPPSNEPDSGGYIASAGHNAETWSAVYIEAVKAASDIERLNVLWAANQKALGSMHSGHHAIFKKIEDAIAARTDELKAPKPADKKQAAKPKKGEAPSPKDDPEGFLNWADNILGAITDAGEIETVYDEKIKPHEDDCFAPDLDELYGIRRKHEKRLGAN